MAICHSLAAEGAKLIMVSRGEEALEVAVDAIEKRYETSVMAIPADLSQKHDVDRVLEHVAHRAEGIDILVQNTGGPPPGDFTDHDDVAWSAAFEGLLMSVVRLCRGVLPGMKARGWGRIILNTSFTVKEPAPRLILSNVFRTGVVSLAKTLSREVATDGITVNTVCPGAFDTDRLRSIFEEQAQSTERSIEAVRSDWEERIPIGRILQPKKLADLVAFLASDLAGGITGGSFPIEGGMLRGLF